MRNLIKNLMKVSVLALVMPIAACNAQTESGGDFAYRDGVDFQTLARPVATTDPSRVELAEVFWYGCIHCYRLEPMLETFVEEELPEEVNFVRVPASWHPTMDLHAKLYFAANALGIVDEIHWDTFKAMNEAKNPLANESAIFKLIEDLGQDRAAFERAFNSFGVNSQLTQAKSKAAAYGIRGTPEIIVNGKYRVSTTMTGTQEKMLDVALALVERELAMMEAAE